MKVIVCGGRNYGRLQKVVTHEDFDPAIEALKEKRFLSEKLAGLYVQYGFTHVIHGDANGADTLAGEWAESMGLPVVKVPAAWDFYGNSAGIRRNIWMLALLGKDDMVIAFPGGRGTQDMVARAKSAKIRVIEVNPNAAVAPKEDSTVGYPGRAQVD